MHPVRASTLNSLSPNLLMRFFSENNQIHFDGFLDEPLVLWNPRLRKCSGRFIPGSRKFAEAYPAKIEIASYLLEETDAFALINDTLAHEMIHYWLWVRRQPYGHTPEFWRKMKAMGVSRYNSVPRGTAFQYSYQCVHCKKSFTARKRWGSLACSDCCSRFSGGKYDPQFKLILVNSDKVHYD